MSVHYGDPQVAIAVVFAVLALLLAAAFIVIGLQAGSEVSFDRVQRTGHWLRKRWLSLLIVVGVIVVGISLFDLPYATGSAAGRTVVQEAARAEAGAVPPHDGTRPASQNPSRPNCRRPLGVPP